MSSDRRSRWRGKEASFMKISLKKIIGAAIEVHKAIRPRLIGRSL